jgi:hypothetical protein
MASSTRIRLIRWLPDIQFSLRTLIAVMTVISVSLAIMRWQFAAGAMAGMAIFGVWTVAAAAIRKWRMTALLIAAFTSGLLWYVVAALPLTPLGELMWETFPSIGLALLCSIASLLCAIVSRVWSMLTGKDASWLSCAALPYLMVTIVLALLLLIALLLTLLREDVGWDFETIVGNAAWFAYGWAVIVTMSLYVLLPLAWAFLALLHGVEDVAHGIERDEREVADAIRGLELRGYEPIHGDDVARLVGQDRASVDYFLERLRQTGGLSWSAERGFGFRNVDGHS